MKLHEVLTYYRKLNKITFDELVTKTGIPKSTLQKVFTGVTANPAFELVRTITEGLDVSINDVAAATRESNPEVPISHAARDLARRYDALDDHSKKVVEAVVELESKRPVSHLESARKAMGKELRSQEEAEAVLTRPQSAEG